MTIKSLTGPARPGVSLDDGSTEKFKVFCRPPQTRNNNNNKWRGPQGASLPPRLCLSYILHPICFYPTRSVPCTDSLRARAVPPARRHAQNVRGLHDME